MIIFLSGSSGFIGSSLSLYFLERSHKVKTIPSKDLLRASTLSQTEFNSYLFDKIGVFDCIVHSAGMAHRDSKNLSWSDYHLSNVHLSHRLSLSVSASGFCKQFIFLSSCKVYGDETIGLQKFSSSSKCFPACFYGHSKYQAELAIAAACECSDLSYTFLRLPLVYGPNVKANFLYLLKLAALGFPNIFSNVSNKRSFLYLKNLSSFVDTVILNPRAYNLRLNVSDHPPISTSSLFAEISSCFGHRSLSLPIPGRLMRTVFAKSPLFSSFVLDDSLLLSRFGWNPPFSTSDGLRSACAWYSSEFGVPLP